MLLDYRNILGIFYSNDLVASFISFIGGCVNLLFAF